MKVKELKSKITYDTGRQDIYLQLKKRCRWCWLLLLLLLLPLLLLIPLKQKVTIKLIDSYDRSVITDTPVYLEYRKRDFFSLDSLRFFTNYYPVPQPALIDSTDADGIAVFEIEYSVYQWITFFWQDQDIVRAYNINDCYVADSAYLLFDMLTEVPNDLYVLPVLLDFEFTVVDTDDKDEPLRDALVRISSDRYGIVDSARSDAAGRVLFKKIPKCSNLEVIGSKYGWYNDSIVGDGAAIYQKEDTLYLRQEKVIVKFYAKEAGSRSPIRDAWGYLFFESAPSVLIDSVQTNINGIGKGVFEDVQVIKKIRIDVSCKCYEPNSTNRYYRVDRWQGRTEEQQTIYLKKSVKEVEILLQKCWNPCRDHYHFHVDGEYVAYYKSTTGSTDQCIPEQEGPHGQHDTIRMPLSCGRHVLSLHLYKEYGAGTCVCTTIKVPSLGVAESFSRVPGSADSVFRVVIDVE